MGGTTKNYHRFVNGCTNFKPEIEDQRCYGRDGDDLLVYQPCLVLPLANRRLAHTMVFRTAAQCHVILLQVSAPPKYVIHEAAKRAEKVSLYCLYQKSVYI
jgi:hypothetical protein